MSKNAHRPVQQGAGDSRGGTDATRRRERDQQGERTALDDRHDSSARGEHRYPDTHQTEAERKARRDRDDLKRRLEEPQ